ncbi:hypothetical protein PG999_014735 [Apiospora kogelbergensis]|uniref:Clr5 domain-containing protein n=1 Tax=Apiospora kogelbergensis TaxID=1337665 RepID=A0AAW0QDE4_9PEZI
MESEGFVATRTQYVYQFGKWGLHKYDTERAAEKRPGTPEAMPLHPAMVSVAVPDPEKKRTRSIQTVESCGSSLSSSFQPRSKRTKMCNEDIAFQYFRLDLLPEPYMTRSNSPAPSACTYDPEKTTAEGSHFTESTVEISVADASGQRNELLRMVESPKMNPMDLDPSKSAQSGVPTSEQAFQLYKDEANELADHSKKRPSLEFGRQPSGMNSMPLQAAEYLFATFTLTDSCQRRHWHAHVPR